MNRWFWKRWVWAVVVGTTAAVGLTVAQQGGTDAPSGPPKAGDVITLKFRDMPDRQVKVLKSDKQPDGSYLSEVKDTKTGETFTLLDKPEGESAPKAAPKATPTPPPAATPSKAPTKAVEASKSVEPAKPLEANRMSAVLPKLADGPAKAKPRTNDPLIPAVKDTLPDMAKDIDKDKDKDKERRFFPSLGKSSTSASATPTPPPPASAPAPESEEDRPGLLKRVFGRKKPTTPASPTTQSFPSTSTSAKPSDSRSSMPPAVRSAPTVTMEPPRTQAVRPVEPPTPSIPAAITIPTGPANASNLPAFPSSTVPTPAPVTLPAIPTVPSLGVPAPSGLPTIPIPPGGTSKSKPTTPPKSEVATADVKTPAAAKGEEKVLPAPAGEPVPTTVVPATRVVATPAVPVVAVPAPKPTPQDPAVTAMMQDIEPYLKSLQNGPAPSHRAIAARALSGCRHSSSDLVKMSLFRAAQSDGNPMVRAVCIEELVKLGYYEPAFTVFLTKAAEESSEEVRKAAKDALHQMQPRR